MFVSNMLKIMTTSFCCTKTWPLRYNWTIIDRGVKHHNPTQPLTSVYSTHYTNKVVYKTGFLQVICIYTRTDICKGIGQLIPPHSRG